MTKTITTIDSYNFANPGLPAMIPLAVFINGSFVCNFEFESLGFV